MRVETLPRSSSTSLAPITVHTSAALKTGLIAQRILNEEGVDLAKAGYADRMVLAHDASCYSDFCSESYKTALPPRWNYTHITDDVLPALREHGVDEAQITAMLVHNPARYFTGGQE